jgi:glycosyltransferase involved in cell wall biosynthesis
MKILHLTEHFSPVGGLEQYLFSVLAASRADGHESIVAYGLRTGREPTSAGLPVEYLPGLASPAPLPKESLECLGALAERHRPDVAVIHEIFNREAVSRIVASIPSIRFLHGHKLVCPGGRRVWHRRNTICTRPLGLACQGVAYLERCMPRNLRVGIPIIHRTQALAALHRVWSELLAPSAFVRDLMLQNGFAREQVHVVPYFTTQPEPPPAETAPPVPGRLFCAARLVPEKGVDHLLRALAELPPPAHLVLAGEGPSRPDLERQAEALSLRNRVQFAGLLGRSAMRQSFEESEIVVVPSVWPETFGIVGIEAMAHARPVVAYDAGGIREWLAPDRVGLLVPRGDIPGLTAAIRSLLADPKRREACGSAGRRVVEQRFLARHHLQGLLAVADKAILRWQHARHQQAMVRPFP